MAKKKSARHDKPAEQPLQQQDLKPQQQPHKPPSAAAAPMEDLAEKLENVKSLNSILVKETSEKRQEVSNLLESKKSLESELSRSYSEVETLRDELAQFMDGKLVGEMEKEVFSAFMESQAVCEIRKEMEVLAESNERVKEEKEVLSREKEEVERRLKDVEDAVREKNEKLKEYLEEMGTLQKKVDSLCVEVEEGKETANRVSLQKDALEKDLKLQVENVTTESREKLVEMDGLLREKVEEIAVMKAKYEDAMRLGVDRESEIRSMRAQLDSMEENAKELQGLVEYAKSETEEVCRQKVELEVEKSALTRKVSELEEELSDLHSALSSLKEEEQRKLFLLTEMEKSSAEAMVREEDLKSELSALLEEKKEREFTFEKLVEEKTKALKDLGESQKNLETAKRTNEALVQEKNEINQAKTQKENEIAKLLKEASELNSALLAARESYVAEEEKNEQLQSSVRQVEELLDQTSIERDETLKAFDEEKANGVKLKDQVSELLNKMNEAADQLEGMRFANEALLGEKKRLESVNLELTEEKTSVETRLSQSEQELVHFQRQLEVKGAKLDHALTLLKSTAAKLSTATENGVVEDVLNEKYMDEEMEAYLEGIQEIRSAFKNRDAKMQEMHCSIVDTQKKKSFWTVVSSATTIFAAIMSFAYASRGR